LNQRNILKFGEFGLDLKARLLLKGGQPVHLARKAAETLLVLLQNSPNLVSKEELLAAIWPDQIVDEHNLTQSIATIRRTLEVASGSAGYIETFPGRGYRVLGPVVLEQQAAPGDPSTTAPDQGAATVEPLTAPPSRPRTFWLAMVGVAVLAAAGAVMLAVWLRRSERLEVPSIVPLSRQGGKQYQPAVSPGGATVAFLWQKENAELPRIWMQDLNQSTPRPLTDKDGEYSSPAWSPDGRSIACLRFRENAGELVVIAVAGGGERVLGEVLPTRFGLPYRHLDWSPDGEWIALDDAPTLNNALAIYLVNVKTGTRTRVTRPEDIILGDVAPRFSPDGSLISFIRVPHRVTQELRVVPRQGGSETVIDGSNHEISDQAWLPGPPMLAFASNRSGEFRIWKTRPAAARSPRDVVGTAVYGEFPIQFALVAGGSGLVYSVLHTDRHIWRYDLSAQAQPDKAWRRLIASPGQNASPQYSPDGSRICFRSDRSGKEELWVARADGSGAFPITSGSNTPSVPRWAPDGRSVVFNVSPREIMVASERDGKWGVRALNAQGAHPVYSPDGRWIYAGAADAIVRYPAEGGAPTTIASVRGMSFGVSPDGGSLYFVRAPGDTRLWRYELASAKLTQVLDGLVPYCGSCWAAAPDGIYFLGAQADSRSQQALFFHDFGSSRNRIVAPYPEPVSPFGAGPFSLSPDRRYLLTVRLDPSTTDLLRVEHFR
jgi:Tol biopolymer transport system component/DNA-binding winged helix-turn-helix (wHTH) protein